MYEFKLPDLGEGVHEGEILKWHVGPGDTIREDDPLVEVETDKAAVSIPSPVGGTVVSVAGKRGDVVKVGSVIAVIDTGAGAGVAVQASTAPAPTAPAPMAPAAIAPASAVPAHPSPARAAGKANEAGGGHRPAAPATRRLARERGVDIDAVLPTGPAGRVTPEDVERHAAAAAHGDAAPDRQANPGSAPAGVAPESSGGAGEPRVMNAIPFLELDPLPDFSQWGPVEKEPLVSIRRKVARKMVTSKILIPHVTHMDEADVTALDRLRLEARAARAGKPGGKLTLLAFVVKAVTAGLRAAAYFNASIDPFGEQIVYKRYYNIGIAVDTGKGLVVPVIRDADRKSILQISADIEDLARRGRDGKLESGDMKGGTFTITNVGPMGGTALIPAINYPEAAILGMGKVQEKPVVRDGQIVIARILPLSLSFDHRIADGADAAKFVGELVRRLSDPATLMIET